MGLSIRRVRRQFVAVLLVAYLSEHEGLNQILALGLDIHACVQDRPVRERIPTAPVFLDLFRGRNPLKTMYGGRCTAFGSHEQHGAEEQGGHALSTPFSHLKLLS